MRKREQAFRKLKQKIAENRSTLLGWAVLFLMLCLSLCNMCRALQVGSEAWCEKQQEETGGSVCGYLWKVEQTEKSIRLFVLGEPVAVYVPREEAGNLHPGQKIKVSGEIEPFAEARNPGQFSMREYMRALGYGGQLRAESWHIEEAQSVLARIAEHVGGGLYRLKNWISTTLEETCAVREAGILRAMLAGEKTALTE